MVLGACPTGRPVLAAFTGRAEPVRRRRRTLLIAALSVLVTVGCSDDLTPGSAPISTTTTAPPDVASAADTAATICALLRTFVNDTVDIANRAAARVTDIDDPATRSDAVLLGFDQLTERTRQHQDDIRSLDVDDLLAGEGLVADLQAGADEAMDELADERAAFERAGPVSDADRTGRVAQFFNALEKVMSVVEPTPGQYAPSALRSAFADEPGCTFVVQ